MSKLTLFKAIDSCHHFSIDGCIPSFVNRDEDEPEIITIMIGEHGSIIKLRDQDICTDADNKVWVNITNVETGEDVKEEIMFFKITSLEEIISPPICSEQKENDSANYSWILNRAKERGSYSFDTVIGHVEFYDDSNTEEIDKAITKMRKKHEQEKTY